jgi:hypothetical protein
MMATLWTTLFGAFVAICVIAYFWIEGRKAERELSDEQKAAIRAKYNLDNR